VTYEAFAVQTDVLEIYGGVETGHHLNAQIAKEIDRIENWFRFAGLSASKVTIERAHVWEAA